VRVTAKFVPPEEGGDEFTEMSCAPGGLGEDFSDDEDEPKMGKMVLAGGSTVEQMPALTREEQRKRLADKTDMLKERFQSEQKRLTELNEALRTTNAELASGKEREGSQAEQLNAAEAALAQERVCSAELQARVTELELRLEDLLPRMAPFEMC